MGSRATATSNDRSSKKDYLGFKPYVEALAEFITDTYTKPPITISVEGLWGSGKSSFLKQLEERVKELNPKAKVVKFNPWRYSGEEALWASFAIELEAELQDCKGWWKLVFLRMGWSRLKRDCGWLLLFGLFSLILHSFGFNPKLSLNLLGGNIVELLLSLVAGAIYYSPLLPFIGVVLELKRVLSSAVIKFDLRQYLKERPDYQGKVPFLKKFHSDIELIVKAYSEKEPIYVFIDDLDRCSPDKAIELLKAINLLMDIEGESNSLNLYFILALDREKVAAGYGVKHKEFYEALAEGKATKSIGYEYIDKFIQLPFRVPTPEVQRIEEYVDNLIRPNETTEVKEEKVQGAISVVHVPVSSRALPESDNQVLKETPPKGPIAKEIKFDESIDDIKEIMSYVSPILGNNPRKIKKFLNQLRLSIYLGNRTALFGIVGKSSDGDINSVQISKPGEHRSEYINLAQLASYIALSYAWPEFISEWLKNDRLLWDVHQIGQPLWLSQQSSTEKLKLSEEAYKRVESNQSFIDASESKAYKNQIQKWLNQEGLFEFIHQGFISGSALWGFPLKKLMTVSPVYIIESEAPEIKIEGIIPDSEEPNDIEGFKDVSQLAESTEQFYKRRGEKIPEELIEQILAYGDTKRVFGEFQNEINNYAHRLNSLLMSSEVRSERQTINYLRDKLVEIIEGLAGSEEAMKYKRMVDEGVNYRVSYLNKAEKTRHQHISSLMPFHPPFQKSVLVEYLHRGGWGLDIIEAIQSKYDPKNLGNNPAYEEIKDVLSSAPITVLFPFDDSTADIWYVPVLGGKTKSEVASNINKYERLKLLPSLENDDPKNWTLE